MIRQGPGFSWNAASASVLLAEASILGISFPFTQLNEDGGAGRGSCYQTLSPELPGRECLLGSLLAFC